MTREEQLNRLNKITSRSGNTSGIAVSDEERKRRLNVLDNYYKSTYLPEQASSWAKSLNDFQKKISADAQARSKGYQSQESLKAYQDSISEQIASLKASSKYAQEYARLSGNRNYIKSITDSLGYLDSVTKGLQDEQKYWANWANEDAYKASPYYFDNEYADAAKNYDTDVIKAKNDAYNDFFKDVPTKKNEAGGFIGIKEFADAWGYDEGSIYNELTDNEARMYAYIRDKVGYEEGRKYLNSIAEDLSYRQGAKKANRTGSWMGLVNVPQFHKDIIGKVESSAAGLENAFAGLMQTTANTFFNKDYVAVTPSSVYAHQIRQENDTEFGKVIGDLMFTTGNMLPSIGVSAVSKSPLLGAGITAMSSGGNAYSEARRQGYSHEQATVYGMINGALEGGLQYALGGIGKLGGKLSGKLINKIGDKLLPAFSNIKSGVARAVLSAGGKFLGNAASEAFEEGLQSVLDPLVRSMVLQEDLNIDWNEVGYSAMLGAMSAGLWEGGSIVSNSVQANAIGKKAFESGAWQGAVDYALALDPNSTPYKLAKGLQDGSIKADGNNIGNLYSALVEYMQESSKLVRKGKMTTDQYVSGQSALQQIYEARSKAEAENNAHTDISPNIMSASLYQEIKGLGLDEKTATKYSNAIANLKEGTEVHGKITNELISGNSPVRDIVARELGIDTTNKTAAELRNAVKSYVDTVKSQPKTETTEQTAPKTEKELQYEQAKAATAEISKALGEAGQAVYNEFSEGMRTGDSLMYFNNAVFDFYNQGVEASLKKNPPKKYTDIEGYEGIAPIIKQRAFEAGKIDNKTKAEAVKKTEEKVKSDIKEIKARQRELKHVEFDIKDLAPSAGKWTVDEGVDVNHLDKKQRPAFNYLKAVSEVSGINVHIMSGVNEKGELTAENGFYDSETNTVYVSINAGAQSLTDITNTAVLKTASHEITHYIAATDTDAYQELRDYVVETFKKEHGEDGLARRISDIQEIYKDQINKDLSYEKAIEEMVANACETMIRNSKVFSQLARQNMTVAERLKDGLDRFIAKMDKNREAALEGIEETSLEARLIASNADTLKKAQELWDNALKAAIKKNQTVPDSKVTNATTEVQNPNVMQNLRTMTEDYWAYRNDVVLKGLMTSQEYDKLFNSINVIMDMARKNPDILDFGADIDSNNRPFSAIKPNSDPLYKVSLDFSTLCRKRLLQQAIVNRLQAKLKRSLTATEQTQIRNELVKLRKEGKKIEVACALCYVEAARLKSPDVINDFLENRRKYAVDYFSKKNKEFNKLIAKKQGDYLASQGIKRDATKSQMGKEAAEYLDTNKPIWRQEYQPTANEEAAIKILEDMDAAELLSVQGLAKLRLANPVAYDIYTSRVRTATKSKAQETNMPFKRGDTYGFVDGNGKKTKAISKKLIADMNAENGLRYQSWSDFQAMHILDNIAAVMELATRGAKMQTYTKVPDFVTLNGKTGMMINMSLLAKGNGFNADGNFAFDPIEGMPFEEMQKLRDQFPETAGNIIVAVSDEHLRALLASNDIDYVIPYHLSGLNENLRLMMSIEDWVDYTRTQGEKSNGKENVNGVKMWHKAPKFSEWFDAEAAAKAVDGYAFMRESAQKYLALCEERGLVPKFDEFKTEENYWKLLIDRKMVNHKTGKVILQQAVKPIFDENAITVAQNAIADEQAIKDFREVQDPLVEQITSGKVEISKKMTAELVAMQNAPFTSEMETESDGKMFEVRGYDFSYAHTETKQFERWFGDWQNDPRRASKVVNPDGTPKVMYHGTSAENGDFWVFDYTQAKKRGGLGLKTLGLGNYFTSTELSGTERYGSRVIPVYLNIRKPLVLNAGTDFKPGVSRALHINAEQMTYAEIQETMRNAKYDGVIKYDANGEIALAVAFDSTQIKSATENIGTFDPTNPDIRYSLRYDETEFNARRELSTALLTVAQTDAERTKLEVYQKMVKTLNEQEELLGKMKDKLAQIDKEKEFKRYTDLEKKIRKKENWINAIDSRLINLEATKPLKDIVARKEARLKEQFARSSTTRAKHRNNIKQKIRSLDQKLRTNSGQKHILKEFQPVIASLLETFTNNTSVFKSDQLDALKVLYAQFKPDPTMIVEGGKHGNDVANKYDDVEYAKDLQAYANKYVPIIAENIEVIAPIMENKRLIDLDAETLAALDQVISNINHIIVGSEEIFVNNKAKALKEIADNSLVDMDNSGYKASMFDDNAVKDFFEYKNTLPVFVMERLGDTVIDYLWQPLMDGAANMVREQVADTNFLHGKMREHNAQSWQDKTFRIKLESGKEIALTQEQAMYIYAAAKREATHKGVGGKKINHLGKGGITIPNIVKEDIIGEDGKPEKYLGLIPKKKKNLKDKTGTPLTDNDIAQINKLLSNEQKKYVDEVVEYLSTIIAARGNKVSNQLYGIDLFTEKYYVPLMSAADYLNVSFMGQTDRLIKNAGMTKSLTQGANNPIVVDDFTAIVAQHLQQMERYDSLAVPLDNFNRWLNYQSYDEDAKGNRTKNGNGVRMTMSKVYGDGMQRYINQLLKDANAASTRASNEGLANRLIGRFRKNAVLASLSVALQQPSAIGRAYAYIDAKYFFKNVDKLGHKENIEQMLKYSDAAFIKENGSFDPAISKNAIDQMLYLEPETASEKIKALFAKDGNYRDELLGALPKAMDRITWGKIWRAVKAEIAKSNPDMDVTSEEFLELAAERFDYVINRTQVYDSTLSKSELMRSKSAWWKLNTSFAAEPTMAYNTMLKAAEDLAHAKTPQAKKIAGAFLGRTVVAYTVASALNALLKSLITAARKDKMDDENDKSYIEWYVHEVLSNFLTDSNPLSLLPLVRDVWSLIQGYDLSRTDMEAVVMFKDAVESVVNENKPLEQKLADILKALGIAFGVPVENILRDGEAIINVIVDIFDGWETSWQGIADAAQSGVADVTKWDIAPESGNTADKLYKAMMNGDTNAYKQYYADIVEEFNKKKQEGKTDSKNVESYIRSQMRKRLVDSAEIKAAYEASKASNFAAYDAAVKALTSKGFHPNDVRSAINSYEERLKKAETSEPTVEEYEEEDVKLDKGLLVDAIANGKELEVIAAEQSKYKKGSQEYKDNAAKIKRYITQELKPLYQDYFLQGNTAAYNAIAKRLVALRQYGINYDADTLADWRKKAKEDRA